MSYTVLARKWRPHTFAEMAGQEHVLRALINALESDRIHHAFLFAGTRGVGKTTVARILAKCLNCEAGVTSSPCGECAACNEIDEGRFVDLIEVDAASRTKVDDTRELLDNVQYSPTRGRYKVYLIDEVHMLSKHSFNALLKTLEEPPPHVKFLLATTDPQKLPVTVLSRCLQFNLKRLPIDLIEGRLRMITDKEEFTVDENDGALRLLARAADGSMRDALSLLDQAVSFAGGQLNEKDVRAMLGTVDRRKVVQLVNALARRDATALLERINEIDEHAPDYDALLADVAAILQRAAIVQAVPAAAGDSRADAKEIKALASSLSAEDLQLFYQIALIGRRDLALAPDARAGIEMVMLRMLAFSPGEIDSDAVPEAPPAKKPEQASQPRPAAKKTAVKKPAAVAKNTAPNAAPGVIEDWQQVVDTLPVQGAARQLAAHCLLVEQHGERLKLRLDAENAHFLTDQVRDRLQSALGELQGRAVRLTVDVAAVDVETPAGRDARKVQEREDAARDSIENDPNVKAMKDMFGATIEDESVKPLD